MPKPFERERGVGEHGGDDQVFGGGSARNCRSSLKLRVPPRFRLPLIVAAGVAPVVMPALPTVRVPPRVRVAVPGIDVAGDGPEPVERQRVAEGFRGGGARETEPARGVHDDRDGAADLVGAAADEDEPVGVVAAAAVADGDAVPAPMMAAVRHRSC